MMSTCTAGHEILFLNRRLALGLLSRSMLNRLGRPHYFMRNGNKEAMNERSFLSFKVQLQFGFLFLYAPQSVALKYLQF